MDGKRDRRRGHKDEFLRLSFEAAPNGILLVDEGGAITMVNSTAERMFGYAREELVGRPIDILLAEKLDALFADPEARPLGRGREVLALRKDGTEFPVEIGLNPVQTEHGRMTFCTVVDITERKRAERQLRELNESLEQRVTERTRMAEHRTRQLRALAAELTQTEHRERLRLAQTLHDHIQQLLVAAKLKLSSLHRAVQGQQAERLVSDVEALISETVDSSRSLAVDLSPPILRDAGLVRALEWLSRRNVEKHGLLVDVQAPPEAEPRSEEIRFLLFDAIRELLFNVVKHARTNRATVRLSRGTGGELRVEVEDAGAGFDPEAEAAAPHEGFGLLHIRERLELLGGLMLMHAAPGKGTRIEMTVPDVVPLVEPGIAPAVAEIVRAATEPGAAPSRARVRVLIADDHRIVRQGLVGLLASDALIQVVGEAANGAEAVEQARLIRPDVVVMDINMPRMNGIEATRLIKQEFPLIAIIGLSLHAESDMAESMKEAGATDYISKDGPSEDLLNAIRSLVPGLTPGRSAAGELPARSAG
ncbi:MAG: response regulator [Candidatus Polarisedimenticolia bacterium]